MYKCLNLSWVTEIRENDDIATHIQWEDSIEIILTLKLRCHRDDFFDMREMKTVFSFGFVSNKKYCTFSEIRFMSDLSLTIYYIIIMTILSNKMWGFQIIHFSTLNLTFFNAYSVVCIVYTS